jgi:ATPase subunit of ABC transporter with duplicated ATPase domains
VRRLEAAARAQRERAATRRDTRPPRDNDRFAPHFFAQRATQQAGRKAKELERRIARVETVEEPRIPWALRLDLGRRSRSGDLVAELRDVEKTYGAFRLGPVSLTLTWQERLAVHGPNGAGKTVLLSLLTGAVAPDAGTVRVGAGVEFGVLRQSGADLVDDRTGLEVFRDHVGADQASARTLLAKFDLGADDVLRPVAGYSPGERCRLGLAMLMARGANCLVLDEPTNHLDIEAQEQLEQALATFDGTLVVVSHDREFLSRIALTRHVELEAGQVNVPSRPA